MSDDEAGATLDAVLAALRETPQHPILGPMLPKLWGLPWATEISVAGPKALLAVDGEGRSAQAPRTELERFNQSLKHEHRYRVAIRNSLDLADEIEAYRDIYN